MYTGIKIPIKAEKIMCMLSPVARTCMYVCMYVCIYVCEKVNNACVYIYIHIHTHTYIYIHVHMYVYRDQNSDYCSEDHVYALSCGAKLKLRNGILKILKNSNSQTEF